MEYEIEFYETEKGRSPVNDFLNKLQDKQKAKVLQDIEQLRLVGSDLHFPRIDFVKGDKYKGLMELRTKYSTDIFRIFYFMIVNNKAVLLHAFQKKTQKTPSKELDTALARMKDYRTRRSE